MSLFRKGDTSFNLKNEYIKLTVFTIIVRKHVTIVRNIL